MDKRAVFLGLIASVGLSGCSNDVADTTGDTIAFQASPIQLSHAVVSNPAGSAFHELRSLRGLPTVGTRIDSGSELYVLNHPAMRSNWLPIAGTDGRLLVNKEDIRITASTAHWPGYVGQTRSCPLFDFEQRSGRLIKLNQTESSAPISIFGRDEAYAFAQTAAGQLGWISKHCAFSQAPSIAGKTIAVIHYGIPPNRTGGVEVNLQQHTTELVRLHARVKYLGGVGGGNNSAGVSEVIRPEYGTDYPGAEAAEIKAQLLQERTKENPIIPGGFEAQVNNIRNLLAGDLSDVDYVIVHNVHSIPFEGNFAFPVALRDAITTWASGDARRRAVFLAHDMPSSDRIDLIERLGLTTERFLRGERGVYPFEVFASRIGAPASVGTDTWVTTQIGYGSISANQRDAAATLYQTEPSEISLIPTTGVSPQELQGEQGLSGSVGLRDEVKEVLVRRGVLNADAVLVYPARIGVPRKRLGLAIDAVIEARKRGSAFSNIHLIITAPWQAGRKKHEEDVASMRQYLCERGAENYVTLLAYELSQPFSCNDATVPIPVLPEFEDVAALMRLAGGLRHDSLPGFGFMTTSQEGGGMPQVEAIVAGTEVITTDLDVFKNTLNGIFSVSYFRLEATANEIAEVLITQLQRRFQTPGAPVPVRSQISIDEIQRLIYRYSWEHIVGELMVPWLVGTRWIVEP